MAQKLYLAITLACETIVQTFYALYPLFITAAFQSSHKFYYFSCLMAFWLFVNVLEFISVYFSALLEIQSINSIQFNAFKFFLTVDPIHHTMKTSGKLYAKIERCARSYEDFLDIILWDILPMIVSLIAVISSLFVAQYTLGIVALFLLLFIAIANVTLNLLTSFAFEKRLIHADDSVKGLHVESLTQAQLIRSSFATDEITALGRKNSENLMFTEGTGWLAFAASTAVSRFFYVVSIIVLGLLIISYIMQGQISVETGMALIYTYINGTYEIIRIGQRLRKLNKSVTRINDLFQFIRGFGKQTFPVLCMTEEPAIPKEEGVISLIARGLHFDYNPKAVIFEGHNLTLEVNKDHKNKLYGIIGPSGMGKTTLLSLLGGQLKPDAGIIRLNGISIYDVDDAVRRSLIAMQGQIASSLSGTVRRNLLLGLPQNHESPYSDEEIITVLKQVGIWPIFEEKEGLDTLVGESGLTISGGQRQRLNFASLFLRAQYYKPVLILIDEPTSSLDEVSERAITSMISQLAERALTLVIAHRLKTLDDAVGIVDFSLLDVEKDIIFYTRDELIQKSTYYKKLIQGDVAIEA